jgi:hypothetical protein
MVSADSPSVCETVLISSEYVCLVDVIHLLQGVDSDSDIRGESSGIRVPVELYLSGKGTPSLPIRESLSDPGSIVWKCDGIF